MHPVKAVSCALLVLPAAELAVFIALALFVGLPTAFALLILMSVAGVMVLRRSGKSTLRRLRAGLAAGAGAGSEISLGSEIGTAVGGILLVIPGFITGLLGAALVFPASRQGLVALCRRFLVTRRPAGPEVIDLNPNEWQRLPTQRLAPGEPPHEF